MSKRIGIDNRALDYRYQTGIQRVNYNVLSHLLQSNKAEYYLYGKFRDPAFTTANFVNFDISDRSYADKLIALKGYLDKIDLWLSFYYPVPLRRQFRAAIMINDLIALRYPQFFDDHDYTQNLMVTIGKSAQTCDVVFAISHFTKAEIVHFFSIPPEKIIVTPLGVDQQWFAEADPSFQQQLTGRYHIHYPYILSVCTLEPRKNIRSLIKAYEMLRHKRHERIQLVLTGAIGWKNQPLLADIRNSPFSADIITTGFVSDQDLRGLYKNALAFAYPSLIEGFGLPILEAMACGAPVITSNTSSMPEVAGDCAVYCNPYEVDSIYEAIRTIIDNEQLREKIVQGGRQRAKTFTWERTGTIMQDALLACMEGDS